MSTILADGGPIPGWAVTLIQTFAWPAASVAIAAMFRAELRLALERLTQLKYHDFEAQFRRDLREGETIASAAPLPGEAPAPPAPPSASLAPTVPRLMTLAPERPLRMIMELDGVAAVEAPCPPRIELAIPPGASPREAIEAAWATVAAATRRAAGTPGADPLPELAARGVLDVGSLVLVERLGALRDRMAGRANWSPGATDAARFARLARSILARLAAAD